EDNETLREEVVDLKITVDGLETERDFYFQKLRDIEILCQALEANPDPHMTVSKFVEDRAICAGPRTRRTMTWRPEQRRTGGQSGGAPRGGAARGGAGLAFPGEPLPAGMLPARLELGLGLGLGAAPAEPPRGAAGAVLEALCGLARGPPGLLPGAASEAPRAASGRSGGGLWRRAGAALARARGFGLRAGAPVWA
ncbi:unnamed protein product, partial [Prorocentrum cordatum]